MRLCSSGKTSKMLQNQYVLAKIGFDTAENAPFEVWPACLLACRPPLGQMKTYAYWFTTMRTGFRMSAVV